MRIAFTSITSCGSTFMDWGFNFLTNCNQGKVYSDKTKAWQPTVNDPVGDETMGAHGHPKNHPYWVYRTEPDEDNVETFLKDCKDIKGTITFYPIVNGSLCVEGEMCDVNKSMIQYLIEQDVKVFLIQPTLLQTMMMLGKRSSYSDAQHIAFFQRWFRTTSTSFKEIREQASFRIITNTKKTIEDIQQCHTHLDKLVTASFTDKHWQTNPEDCMKTVCDRLNLKILPDRLDHWRTVADRWIKNNKNINDWYEVEIKKITTAIVENKEMTLPELDLLDQSTIMAYLMKDHGRRLILPTDNFPLDTQILHGYLK